jgi:hypothetical protein
MTEANPGYQITPPIEPETRLTYAWQKKLFKKALQLFMGKKTAVLTVVFFADGCVTFFNGEMDGRVCP